MRFRAAMLAIALGLAGCAVFAPPVPPVALAAPELRQEYLGSEFEGENGDRIRFGADYTYRTADGRTGSFEITPSNTIRFVGRKDSYLVTPDGIQVRRPDLGMEISVVKTADGYLHYLFGSTRFGKFRKLEP